MLLPRILTAIVGIPVIIISVHIGGLVYMSLVGAVIILSLYEYGLILWIGKKPVNRIPLVLFGLLMAAVVVIDRVPLKSGGQDNILALSINLTILGVLLWELATPRRSLERLAYTFFGIFFIPWNLAHLVSLRDIRPDGEYLTLMMFGTVWIADTAAYFAGKSMGKRKLLEEVSPKKTWEGAAAGFIFAVAVSVGLKNIFIPSGMTDLQAAVLGAAAGTVGQVSDLAESIIKRSAGVKDSSSLLPGHGGILDRFDSYLLLAPVYYYSVLFFK